MILLTGATGFIGKHLVKELLKSGYKLGCFVRSEKNMPKNKNIEQQVRLVDLFPTILDLLKIKNNHKIDGISLVPIIKDNINLELPAYSETFYPEEQTQATGKFKNARNKISLRFANKYKYIFHLNSYRIEMYDLEKDKNEKDNLCKSF